MNKFNLEKFKNGEYRGTSIEQLVLAVHYADFHTIVIIAVKDSKKIRKLRSDFLEIAEALEFKCHRVVEHSVSRIKYLLVDDAIFQFKAKTSLTEDEKKNSEIFYII